MVAPPNTAPSFGVGTGIVVTGDPFGQDFISSLQLQPDGKIMVSGSFASAFVLTRFNADGTLDTAFGGGDLDKGLQILPDGKFLLGGQHYSGRPGH